MLLLNPARFGGGGLNGGLGPDYDFSALTGIRGWWDASHLASQTLSGDEVTAVADRSGQGNDLAPASGFGGPDRTGFGGVAWWVFDDANNEHFETAALTCASVAGASDEVCIVAVYLQDTSVGTNEQRLVHMGTSASEQLGLSANQVNIGNRDGLRVFGSSTVYASTTDGRYNDDAPHLMIGAWRRGVDARLFDETGSTPVVDTNTTGNNAWTFTNTERLRIGALSPGTSPSGTTWRGRIGEIAVLDTCPSDIELADIISTLTTKWGL